MILCLDCGNTRLKWGLRDGSEWLADGALIHAEIDRLAERIPTGGKPIKVIGCNVAGTALAEQIEESIGLKIEWITAQATQCGVVNGYDKPETLGADRWAALIGARALHRGAALVVLAGTATTIDVLHADGRFEGGLILPGITMMIQSLASGTAQLPSACGDYREIPRNTRDAIASGAIQATLGAIERMFDRITQEQSPLCMMAGGAADRLQAHLGLPCLRVDRLVLEGLAHCATWRPSDPA